MKVSEFFEKLAVFLFGLFLMSLGIAFAVHAGLGITPISCPPYVFSLYFTSLTLGQLTVGMHITMVLLQVIILRKEFQKSQYSQIIVSFIFGFFIDLAMWITQSVTAPNYAVQILYILLGSLLVAVGIIFEVTPKLMYVAGEGLMLTLAKVFKRPFGQIKVAFDITLVTFSLISSLILLKGVEGIREGTLISAILVGVIVGKLNPIIGTRLHSFLNRRSAKVCTSEDCSVITIGRELGSGGREIGRKLAEKLGWQFIDREFINEAVKKSGLSDKYVETHDQQMTASEKLLRYISMDNLFYDESLSDDDKLFITQSRIIKDAARKGKCVIVGRCADVILQDNKHCFNIFVSASPEFAKKRIANERHISEDEAEKEIAKTNELRRNHYNYYTGKSWGSPDRYNMYLKSSDIGIDKAVNKVYNAVTKRG